MRAVEPVLASLEGFERHEEAGFVLDRDLYPEFLVEATTAALGASCSVAPSGDPQRYLLRIAVAPERRPERARIIREILNTALRDVCHARSLSE